MDIASFSGAATVAATCTIVYVVVSRSWQLISRSAHSQSAFGQRTVREAAQRFRDELDKLGKTRETYLSAGLVFVLLFVAAHALHAERLYPQYPDWQLTILVSVLSIGGLLALTRLGFTIVKGYRIRLLRDANVTIGHRLRRTSASFGEVFHDVDTDAGVIDHVIVSPTGAYAISVFARRPVRNGQVILENSELRFTPSDHSESIVPVGKRIAALEREFRRLLDHRVRVRSVIAVPGWDVGEQSAGEHLVVNEQTLPMLQGWKEESDFLMNEDVDALRKLLDGLTSA